MAEAPDARQILAPNELSDRLQAGTAALFPTDTVPALAARPEAAAQLWQLKQRPARKPMILMGADPEALFAALQRPRAGQRWRRRLRGVAFFAYERRQRKSTPTPR